MKGTELLFDKIFKRGGDDKPERGWFAFISSDDPLAGGLCPEGARCRLLESPGPLPGFDLNVSGKIVRRIDPRDVLFAFGSDRIEFFWESDRPAFAAALTEMLRRRDMLETVRRRAGMTAAAMAGVAAGAVGVMYVVSALRRQGR